MCGPGPMPLLTAADPTLSTVSFSKPTFGSLFQQHRYCKPPLEPTVSTLTRAPKTASPLTQITQSSGCQVPTVRKPSTNPEPATTPSQSHASAANMGSGFVSRTRKPHGHISDQGTTTSRSRSRAFTDYSLSLMEYNALESPISSSSGNGPLVHSNLVGSRSFCRTPSMGPPGNRQRSHCHKGQGCGLWPKPQQAMQSVLPAAPESTSSKNPHPPLPAQARTHGSTVATHGPNGSTPRETST